MPGLREFNRRRTREAISHTATRLFLARGFDTVTIAEVAAAAGVAKMTVTNHFPRKEDLVLDIADDLIAAPGRVVAERAPGESPPAALHRDLFEALDRHDAALGFSGPDFAAMLLGSPALLARLREIHEQREDALAAALVEAGDDETSARLTAAYLTATYRVLFTEVLRRTAAGEPDDSIAAHVRSTARRAFDLLAPGLEPVEATAPTRS